MSEQYDTRLNGICPYFTMFPLEFPLRILRKRAQPGEWVIDPFCGRGTTNYASRLVGVPSLGVDSSPIAAALAQAKLANCTPTDISVAAQQLLEVCENAPVPEGEFWKTAYHPSVLKLLCRLRAGLMVADRSDAFNGLRALIMGGLHGPVNKTIKTYFSNQCTRTFAPKPRYSVRYWKERGFTAPEVNVLDIIRIRAERFFGPTQPPGLGTAVCGDSRNPDAYRIGGELGASWVITSPPYYGMRSYIPDQWLRNWFVGGPPHVDYNYVGQLQHTNPEVFANDLRAVWKNTGARCRVGAKMVIRFGGIHGKVASHLEIIKHSLMGTGWTVLTHTAAGSAASGYRQALHFAPEQQRAIEERDVWALWTGSCMR